MQDKQAIINFLLNDWTIAENRAYDLALQRKNEYIERLQQVIAELCRENVRLTRQERIMYDRNGRPATFRRDTMGRWVEVVDLEEPPTRRRVRRRLFSDSDSDSDSDATTFGDVLGLWPFRISDLTE